MNISSLRNWRWNKCIGHLREILNIRVLHQGECLSRLDGTVSFIPDRIVFTYKDNVLRLDEVPYPVLEAVHNILNSKKCEDSGYVDSRCCEEVSIPC